MKKLVLVVFIGFVLLGSVFSTGGSEKAAVTTKEGPYIFTASRSWDLAQGRLDFKNQPGNQYFEYVKNKLGIVPQCYCFNWEGGTGYIEQVRLLLASGTIPEVILEPFQTQFVKELYDLGILIPLDDYLAEHAPLVSALFTKEELDIVRSLTPDGKIYYIPSKGNEPRQGLIRKDWLKAVGMDVPTTKDELIAVYKAFKEQDANGNGDPNDEIPVSGREGLRWCDDLFVMHGVAMYEGHPEWSWDASKGQMISHQASENMKQALLFIRFLIAEGLMDREAPILPGSDWFAKIAADKVGHYFHLASGIERRLTMVVDGTNPDAEWIYMPNVAVPGQPHQKNYYPGIGVPQICITTEAKDPGKILEWLDWGLTEEGKNYAFYGIEGVNYKAGDNGKIVSEGFPAKQRVDFSHSLASLTSDDYLQTLFGEMKAAIYNASIDDGRALDNIGMPPSVYDGYDAYRPENMGSTYRQFAVKFVLGELPENAWDKYVSDWYKNGGTEITKRATEWYKSVHK